MRSFSGRISYMPFAEQVADHLGLFLSPMKMATHGGDHLRLVPGPTLSQRIGLHVLVEEFIGVEFRTIARQQNQPQARALSRHKLFHETGLVHRMPLHKQIDRAVGLFEQPP